MKHFQYETKSWDEYLISGWVDTRLKSNEIASHAKSFVRNCCRRSSIGGNMPRASVASFGVPFWTFQVPVHRAGRLFWVGLPFIFSFCLDSFQLFRPCNDPKLETSYKTFNSISVQRIHTSAVSSSSWKINCPLTFESCSRFRLSSCLSTGTIPGILFQRKSLQECIKPHPPEARKYFSQLVWDT